MSSDHGGSVLEFPELEERFGPDLVADAAHVLDREAVQDSGPSKDLTLPSRIRGLDTPEEIAVYRAVESQTRGRRVVLELLEDRALELAEKGYRPPELREALLDPHQELPERLHVSIPMWVCTCSLRETPEPTPEVVTAGSWRSGDYVKHLPSNQSSSQGTLAADGGREP